MVDIVFQRVWVCSDFDVKICYVKGEGSVTDNRRGGVKKVRSEKEGVCEQQEIKQNGEMHYITQVIWKEFGKTFWMQHVEIHGKTA